MSNMRIVGLSSGMDIDQMVKDLMKVERVRVDKVEQDKQILKWRQDLYNTLNKDFANFILDTKKEFELTKTASTGTLINNSLSSLNWVKKASSSDETITTVSATAGALDGSYNVSIKRLADGVKAASSENVKVEIDNILAGLGDSEIIEFNINGKVISINKSDDMNSIVKKINSSDAGVQASYDASIGRFFIQTTSIGSEASLSISASAGSKGETFINALKLNVTSYDNNGEQTSGGLIVGESFDGVDALIDFAGATNIVQASNQFTINGVSFDLKKTGDITVKVDTNIDSVYDKISKFVEKYNELVDKIGSELTEKQYRDFKPLTAEQKEAMSEKEVELWEEKAKSGLLRNDMILSRTMQSTRSWMYEEVKGVTGVFDQLTEIGITTEKYVIGSTGGRLEIDETKLKEAIRNDADSVLELLFKESTSVSSSKSESTLSNEELQTKREESGIVTRLYDNMIAGMKDVINKAGTGDNSTLYRNIKSNLLIDFVTEYGSISLLDNDISKLDKKLGELSYYLTKTEERYYSKFTAMEKAIQQMNSQSSWLAQQLG